MVVFTYNLKVNLSTTRSSRQSRIPGNVGPGNRGGAAGAEKGGYVISLLTCRKPRYSWQCWRQEPMVVAAMLSGSAGSPGMLARMVMLVTLAQVPGQAVQQRYSWQPRRRQVLPELTAQLAIRGQHRFELT